MLSVSLSYLVEGERQERRGRAESQGLGSLVARHGEGTAFVDAAQ